MARKIKRYEIEAKADAIESGDLAVEKLAEWDGEGGDASRVARKVRKELDARKRAASQPAALHLKGRVVRETERAVLFAVYENQESGEFAGLEIWLPKSQVSVFERAMGPLDIAELPGWLAEKKAQEIKN